MPFTGAYPCSNGASFVDMDITKTKEESDTHEQCIKWRMDSSRTRAIAAALVVAALATTAPAGAHHSFAADYDAKKPVTLKGTVIRAEWTNPHVHFYLTVTDATGVATEWELE